MGRNKRGNLLKNKQGQDANSRGMLFGSLIMYNEACARSKANHMQLAENEMALGKVFV